MIVGIAVGRFNRQKTGQNLVTGLREVGARAGFLGWRQNYAERMQSGEMLSVEDLQTIRQDLDAMPVSVRAETRGRNVDGQGTRSERRPPPERSPNPS